MGGRGDARAAPDQGTVREGAAAGRDPDRGVPARDHRDREPDDHPGGRRGRGGPLRVQPAVHAGRCCGGAGGGRHRHLRHQGRGHRHLLQAHQRGPGRPAQHHHGRRGGHGQRPAQGARRPDRRDHRRHRGDHHRRDPPARDGFGRRPQVPDRERERCRHQASVRQPLRDRAVHHRRHHAGHEPAPGGTDHRGVRLRDVRPGGLLTCARDGCARGGDGGGSDGGDRGRHGGVHRDAAPGGGPHRRHLHHRDGRHHGDRAGSTWSG